MMPGKITDKIQKLGHTLASYATHIRSVFSLMRPSFRPKAGSPGFGVRNAAELAACHYTNKVKGINV